MSKPDEKSAPGEQTAAVADEKESSSRVGRFIQKYHTFLSSFVIGAAGLIATSIWQYRQSEIARHQAEAQQRVAETQAQNSWKIERAEILAKNLQVLASQSPTSVEQRYGVLLSLARGNILDPELAVSYALELGKQNPDYMQSVLASTPDKDYARLARAFVASCQQKFGISRNVPACGGDILAARSAAIASLVQDDTQAALAQHQIGPLLVLKDERDVQQHVQQLVALFAPTLDDYSERRQWTEIRQFQAYSPGAHLVASLVLAANRTGEFVTADEAKKLELFHDEQTSWLAKYLSGPSCDAECKSRMLDVMASYYDEAHGDYDAAVRQLLEGSRAQSGNAIARLHARLLWCEIDSSDLNPLRDHVLLPALADVLKKPKTDAGIVGDLVGLVALCPVPTGQNALVVWQDVLRELDKSPKGYGGMFRERRATAEAERKSPPPAMRRVSFCGVAGEATPEATD